MKGSQLLIIVTTVSAVLLGGCSTITKDVVSESGTVGVEGLVGGVDEPFVNHKHANTVRNIHRIEAEKYYKAWQGDQDVSGPIGLALSGGGVRSSTFNIGLLAGLNVANDLNSIDVMSTVSGGSYAAYWYYSKLYVLNKEDNPPEDRISDLFSICYHDKYLEKVAEQNSALLKHSDWGLKGNCESASTRFQRHLRNNSLLLRRPAASGKSNWYFAHYIKVVAGTVPSGIISKVGEVFGSHNNINLARDMYKNGIERTYGLYPEPGNLSGLMEGKFFNIRTEDRLFYPNWNGEKEAFRSKPISLTDLKKVVFDQPAKDEDCSISKHCLPPYWVINLTSGVDHQFKIKRNFASKTDQQERFDNVVYEVTPLAAGSGHLNYALHADVKNMKCQNLGDDNSCLRSVSDYVALSGAAVDVSPYYDTFDKLLISAGVATGIGQLGDYVIDPTRRDDAGKSDPFVYLTDGGHSDNLGVFSLLRRGVKQILVSDAEYDPDGEFEGLRRLNMQLASYGLEVWMDDLELRGCIAGEDPVNCISIRKDTDVWEEKPVLQGKIRSIETRETLAQVYYVKLRAPDVFDREEMPRYHPSTKHIIRSTTKKFPQDETTDTDYTADQYYAYFTLGKFYGEQLGKMINRQSETVAEGYAMPGE